MKQRGRKPKDYIPDEVLAVGRAPPPEDLSKRQREIWNEIVNTEPADFFDSYITRAMLKDVVHHRETIEDLTRAIARLDKDKLTTLIDVRAYKMLLKLRGEEIRYMLLTVTKLRLTNQSRYTPRAAATKPSHRVTKHRPWEDAA